ncbi:MAG TPA: NAD(P)/FAD-dependent oxidoreductase [Solirubrobacteraceae bacterium]|nr:NAD(P)/FAD-dependent oxidoreductase [Solirubrobacteraceae bacterium]
MAVRQTKRGAARTPLSGRFDVLICGASFAGLAVARELAGSGADVLVIDRYEVGERQTSACAAPTEWLRNLGLEGAIRQTFGEMLVHAGGRSYRWALPFEFSTFDYRELCALLAAQGEFAFETAKVEGIERGEEHVVHTDRGDLRSPLVVDALGWRRVLGDLHGAVVQPPDARLSRGLEVHPHGGGGDLTLWLDARYVTAGYSWSFPAGDEVRVGVGSFDPHVHVKQPTLRLAADEGVPADGFQGNWIPHQLRPATQDGVFFAGDSAGHCLPTTAEGIRTALYFGIALGRELRAVVEGAKTRERALADYHAFSAAHASAFRKLLRVQDLVGHVIAREWLLRAVLTTISRPSIVERFFRRYLAVAPPEFALAGRAGPGRRAGEPVAA